MRKGAPALLLVAALSSCAAPQDVSPQAAVKTSESPTTASAPVVDQDAAKFGVSAAQLAKAKSQAPAGRREKVASLMMVGVTGYDDALQALRQGVGGVFIGSWTDPSLLTEPGHDVAALRQEIGRPFSVSIDAEGGRVQRQPAIFGSVPAPRTIAENKTPRDAYDIAFQLGSKLKEKGVTVDFAPVVDVDKGPADGAIGDRSFSGDPAVTATYATEFARGLADAGIRPVYKHFPGHGRASGDSHVKGVVSPPLADVKAVDLAPYGPALRDVPAAVMVGHVEVPGLGEGGPSSLNPAAYALLRSGDYSGGAPFRGVIYTDDLSGMKAITDRFTTPQAVLAAVKAGADCALWISTDSLTSAIDAVDQAVVSGEYPEAQLEDSALRIQLAQLN